MTDDIAEKIKDLDGLIFFAKALLNGHPANPDGLLFSIKQYEHMKEELIKESSDDRRT